MVRVLCTNEWCARWTKLTSQTEARAAAVPASFLATVATAMVVVAAVSLLLSRPASPAVVPAEAAKRRFFRSKRGAAERVSLTVADCVYRSRTRKCEYEGCERV
jgi:hypothetical protein